MKIDLASLQHDVYWPKWDSPWWRLQLLHEMGRHAEIPVEALDALEEAIRRLTIPVFFEADVPAGKDSRHTPCHCSLGNLYQLLAASGRDADSILPWARAWFLKHQMSDGGLNCDEEAYRAEPQASSLVATIAPLEAVLYWTSREFTPEEAAFLDRGAQCLIERELRLGCKAPHNQEEREDEGDWLKPAFPRFYFYDVLRGLNFVLRWCERRRKPVPRAALAAVVEELTRKFPDGVVRIERDPLAGVGTRFRNPETGKWDRKPVSARFAELDAVSRIGEVSPTLTEHWRKARELWARLP